MSEQRISKLEEKTNKLDITLGKIEQSLESISEKIGSALEMRDDTIRLKEKCDMFERQMELHIADDKQIHKEQDERIWKYAMMAVGTSSTLAILAPIVLNILTK
ncbi:MAG: hypothetical protein E6R13_02585 [Spirochaetes bacterium]|nr:MAG: hypothetical protein E6R13_02585 [Spirochaetota bacterium]